MSAWRGLERVGLSLRFLDLGEDLAAAGIVAFAGLGQVQSGQLGQSLALALENLQQGTGIKGNLLNNVAKTA